MGYVGPTPSPSGLLIPSILCIVQLDPVFCKMILQETKNKLDATEALYQIAKYLTSNPPVAVTPGSNVEKAVDDHRYWRNIVSHLHYAVIFENSIKILWEIKYRKESPRTHDIKKIYEQLSGQTKEEIKEIYDRQTDVFSKMKGTMQDTEIALGDIVDLAPFELALKSNEATMINFKYDNKFQGKTSVVGNVIWSDDTMWVLPSEHKPFAESLFEYTKESVDKS